MIIDMEESLIRRQCRNLYRDEGSTDCPYPDGSKESLIWDSEAIRIAIEAMESM